MNLDLINGIFNNLKESKFVQNFINELSNYLDSNNRDENVPIIDEILSMNSLTTVNKRSIMWNEEDIILQYLEKIGDDKPIYFVKDSKKTYWSNNKEQYDKDAYTILKVENGKIEEMEISKRNIPKEIGINDVFKEENGNYVIDLVATKELKQEIINMANEIVEKQNMNLEVYRKEGHLYMVTEELGKNRFLWDLTETSKIEFEEVAIPQELLDKATQGIVLQYTNGKYEYYSDDGFERADKIK